MNVHYKILAVMAMLSHAASTNDLAEPAIRILFLIVDFLDRHLFRPVVRAYSNYVAASSWSSKGSLTSWPRESSQESARIELF